MRSSLLREAPDWLALASGRILVVDEDAATRRLLVRMLSETGYDVLEASSTRAARLMLEQHRIALLLTEVSMPGETGLDLLHFAASEHPQTATLLVSALEDPGVAQAAMNFGAHGYLSKPLGRSAVLIGVMSALRARALEERARAASEHAARALRVHTEAAPQAFGGPQHVTQNSRRLQTEIIHRWARAAESCVPGVRGHLERVSQYCGLLAGKLGLHADSLELASVLHDVGMAAIPDRIRFKRGPLTTCERLATETHAEIGYEILRDSSSNVLELAALVAWTHHEKFDGSGYPRGLTGTAIPLEGRIAAVADVFDALTNDRPHRRGWSLPSALAWMTGQRGKHFDPDVVDVFASVVDDVAAIHASPPRGVRGHAEGCVD